MSPDLYDDLCEFLRDQEDADLVDGRWKPNKAMSLLQQLEEEEHAQSLRQPELEGWVSEMLKTVAQSIAEGDGFWLPCSGCHETTDGQETGGYPYSSAFQSIVGGGCRECGGLGMIWDDADYAAMGAALQSEEK